MIFQFLCLLLGLSDAAAMSGSASKQGAKQNGKFFQQFMQPPSKQLHTSFCASKYLVIRAFLTAVTTREQS